MSALASSSASSSASTPPAPAPSSAPLPLTLLTGYLGSGKSTLLALVQGFYRPTSGRITLDGYSVEELDPMWLRRQIGVVLQEPVLFSGTILFNLSFGMPDATHAQVEQAARDANAHDFIARLPDGYLTELGERGVSLSGGQKQRVAIARALVRDPTVLLLDEVNLV